MWFYCEEEQKKQTRKPNIYKCFCLVSFALCGGNNSKKKNSIYWYWSSQGTLQWAWLFIQTGEISRHTRAHTQMKTMQITSACMWETTLFFSHFTLNSNWMQHAGDRIDISFKSNGDRTEFFFTVWPSKEVFGFFERKKNNNNTGSREKNRF